MEQPSIKRPADFALNDDTLPKRSRSNGYGSMIDTSSQRRSSVDSRSPGSPRSSLPSAEVAADFKDSLQDLQMNDRYQISNLTIIAKESTEHAMAISRVLETHIRTSPPARKLPALYVLDSIVKNVGTPYTLYLGQNLYKTFMEAYTLVDGQTRKSMEAMLKTWKEPIPGSMEARPVFPLDIVKPMENALIKAKTMFVQHQQQQAKQRQFHALPPRPAVTATPQPWLTTPTPSHAEQRFAPPPQPEQQHYASAADLQYGLPLTNYQSPALPHSQPAIQSSFYPPQFPPQQASTLLQTHQYQQSPQVLPTPPPQASAPYQNSYSLIALLQAAGTFTPTPQQQQQSTPISLPPPPPQTQPSVFPGLEALFQQTKSAIPDFQNSAFAPPPFPIPPTVAPLPTFAVPTPPQAFANPVKSTVHDVHNDVKLNVMSLKIPRPHLLVTLYASQPSQCTTCGRRFTPDEVGRARKARHLDAHFATNRRMADAVNRAVGRSWYVDELDWIRSREVDDADPETVDSGTTGGGGNVGADEAGNGFGAGGGNVGGGGKAALAREVYVKAAADAAVAQHACPICQEEFRTVWHDGAQEWVWMDAVGLGGKAYHKSCVDELAKDRGGAAREAQRAVKREVGV